MVGVLKKMKMGSTSGEDGIHNEMLINLPHRGLDLLLKFTNGSLDNGFPICLKNAIITMIPKKESRQKLVKFGVPLGPLLFLVCIMDIPVASAKGLS